MISPTAHTDYPSQYASIITRLTAVKRKELLYWALTGIVNALSASIVTAVLFSLLEIAAHGSSIFRGVLFYIWLAATIGSFLLFAGKGIGKLLGLISSDSPDQTAMRVGKHFDDLRDSLCNALQLYRNINSMTGSSPALALAAFDSAAAIAKQKNFDEIIEKNSSKKAIILFSIITLISSLFFGLLPSAQGALYRIIHYNQSFLPPAPFALHLETKEQTKLRGEQTTIVIRATGVPPASITLHIREEKQEIYDPYTIRLDTSGIYRYVISSLKRSVEFYAESPWIGSTVETEHGHIIVIDRPLLRSLSGKLTYPSYTRLGTRPIDEQTADISALRGSQVELVAASNKQIAAAEIVILHYNVQPADSAEKSSKRIDSTIVPMKLSGQQGEGTFAIHQSGEYYIRLHDTDGQTNDAPIHYKIIAMSDGPPTISLLEPTSDAQISEKAILPMTIAIADDYGFSSLKLYYRLAESRYALPAKSFTSVPIPFSSSELTAEISYLWDVNKANISPGDRFEFYVEVTDNDRITGPKSAKTSILSVRLPSLDEVLKQADKSQDQAVKELEKVAKQAEELRKDMEEVNRELRKNQTADWKDKKKLEGALKKHEELRNKVEETSRQLEETAEKLRENNALSPETMQKYMELQKLMKQVESPELRKAMEQMQKAMQQMTPEQLQQAMKNYQFNEEQFKKNIERTINLLKRLQAEQKVDALTKRAEDLSQKQEDLAKQTENANPNNKQQRDEISKKQESLNNDMKSMSQEIKDLESLMKEIGKNMPLNELDKAKQELDEKQTAQDMKDAQEQAEQGDMQKSQKSQKSASQKMQNFTKQMKRMKKEMKKNMNREAMRQMQKSMNDLTELSKRQEELSQKSREMDPNSNQFAKNAQEQQQLREHMQNVAGQMMQLAQKSMSVTPQMAKEMGDALQQMQEAGEQLVNRNARAAANAQGEAMGAMNRSVMAMQDAMAKMQGEGQGQGEGQSDNPGGEQSGSGGPGGFMQRLQQLAGQQQGINNSMQQMGDQGQPNSQQQAELGRIAKEQGRAQKALEELAKEQTDKSGNKKALGDLNKIAEEMKEIVSDLQSGNITPETRRRQERILSRLLDATRSMNERDYENRRESRSGVDQQRKSPALLDLSTQEGKTRALQELLRSVKQGYTKDYEVLIRQYFEHVQKAGAQ